jgi:hypothetical protein
MRYSLLLFAFLFFGCGTTRKAKRSEENVENLKQMAYCKCLDYAINRFVGKDSIDIVSYIIVKNKMDFFGGYFINNIRPSLDSAAKSILLEELKYQFTPNVGEGTYGKVGYRIDCLNFYKSRQLDSLARALSKRINDSIYCDPFYNK